MSSHIENNLKIAVQNPVFIFQDQKKNFNGYNYQFFINYVEYIYITDLKKVFKYFYTIKEMKKNGILKKDMKIILNPLKLRKSVDIVVCFSGSPYEFLKCIPKIYTGMKIYHIMDFIYKAHRANKKLEKNKIDYLLGYCDHYEYSNFFRKYYPKYRNRIISLPFGYGERFKSKVEFNLRKDKVIALGSLRNIASKKEFREYNLFFQSEKTIHKLRERISQNRKEWSKWIDDLLPDIETGQNYNYDPEKVFNDYKMFINDASILNFPPARTYEGIASGCVMVAEDLEVFKELGFIDGYNCILFEKENYNEMIEKIDFYIKNSEKLYNLHKNSLELSKKYSHKKVADYLYNKLIEKYLIWKEEKSGNNCS